MKITFEISQEELVNSTLNLAQNCEGQQLDYLSYLAPHGEFRWHTLEKEEDIKGENIEEVIRKIIEEKESLCCEGQQLTVNAIEKIFNEFRKIDSWYEDYCGSDEMFDDDEDDEDDEGCDCGDCVAMRKDMENQAERIINELKNHFVDNQARSKWLDMEKERQRSLNAIQPPPCLTPQAIGNALSKGESLQDNLDKYRMQSDIIRLLAEIKKLNSQDKQ